MKKSGFLYAFIVVVLAECSSSNNEIKPIELSYSDYNIGLSNSFRGLSVVEIFFG